jgi:ubiquinol-cytochrome c reductase cytochrome b/c1 subunit
MFGSIAVLFVLPWLDTSKVRSATFRPIYRWVFWLLVIDCIVLTWVGGQVPDRTVVWIGQFATLYYFAHFLLILPLLGRFERPLPLPTSIDRPVLAGGAAAPQPAE